MPTILAQAIIPDTSPSDVIIVRLPDAASPDTLLSEAPSVALARINGPELTVWLRDAINTLLAELPLASSRPDGMLIEQGTFLDEDEQVWVQDWYGSPKQLCVARCEDRETSRRLAAVLNALLTEP